MKPSFKSMLLIAFQSLIILVPLIWTSATSELFEFPKMLVTYALTIVICGLWISRMVFEKRVIYRKTPFEFPLLLFIVSQLISTFLSINIHTSLFGYYSRFNGGFISLLCYALLFFAAVSNFDKNDAKIILKTLIFAAFISSLYAFPEHFGHSPSCKIISGHFDATCWVQDVQNRIFGTFGQPNWLAGYLVAIIPIAIYFAVFTKKPSQKWLYIALSLFSLTTIFFTKSQSGIGAAVAMLFIVFVLLVVEKRKTIYVVGFIPLVFIILIAKPTAVTKITSSLNYINPFNSRSTTSMVEEVMGRPGGTDSMLIRRIVWKGAWQLALQHPLFGTGVETFAYAYYGVRPIEHNLVSEWDFLYNKAHNEFLNFAATTGFFGLGTYLLFLGSFVVWSLIRLDPPRSALLAGFIAICVSNFFGFSTVPVNTLLFLFPALAYLTTIDPQSNHPINQPSNYVNSIAYLLTGGISLWLLLAVNRGLLADIAYNEGKSAQSSRNYNLAVTQLQNAVKMVPDEPLYTDELSLTASDIASQLSASNQTKQASEAAAIAVELSNRTLALNPVHLNFYKTRAKVFLNIVQINPAYAVEAAATLDASIRRAPTDAKLWFNRALITEQLGFNEEAIGIYEKTLALKPNYGTARYQYGQLLETLHRPTDAADQYMYILEHIDSGDERAKTAFDRVSTQSAKTSREVR